MHGQYRRREWRYTPTPRSRRSPPAAASSTSSAPAAGGRRGQQRVHLGMRGRSRLPAGLRRRVARYYDDDNWNCRTSNADFSRPASCVAPMPCRRRHRRRRLLHRGLGLSPRAATWSTSAPTNGCRRLAVLDGPWPDSAAHSPIIVTVGRVRRRSPRPGRRLCALKWPQLARGDRPQRIRRPAAARIQPPNRVGRRGAETLYVMILMFAPRRLAQDAAPNAAKA